MAIFEIHLLPYTFRKIQWNEQIKMSHKYFTTVGSAKSFSNAILFHYTK